MDYKKEYKNLVAKIKIAHLNAQTDSTKNVLEDILPALRESDDERIRKEMVDYFSQYKNDGIRGVDITPWIAYLEKQKEQKPLSPDEKMNHPLYLEGFDVGREVGKVEAEQKPAEWSEEDKKILHAIELHVGQLDSGETINGFSSSDMLRVLKSIRPSWTISQITYRLSALID